MIPSLVIELEPFEKRMLLEEEEEPARLGEEFRSWIRRVKDDAEGDETNWMVEKEGKREAVELKRGDVEGLDVELVVRNEGEESVVKVVKDGFRVVKVG